MDLDQIRSDLDKIKSHQGQNRSGQIRSDQMRSDQIRSNVEGSDLILSNIYENDGIIKRYQVKKVLIFDQVQ